MNLANQISDLTQTALNNLHIKGVEVIVDADPTQGDYSTNVALRVFSAKTQDKWSSPRELAGQIVTEINQSLPAFITSVEAAGPGFINFYLNTEYLNEHFALPEFKKLNKTAIVEYMQPNTNKPLHIGHLRNAILGISLINLMKAVGWEVKSATVNNDRGLHITKSMWAYLMKGEKALSNKTWKEKILSWKAQPNSWITPNDMEEKQLRKGDFFVGHWYVVADAFVEDEGALKDWQEMLLAWENADDALHQPVRDLWKQLNDWFYQGVKESYKYLGVSFDPDQVSYESDIYAAGKEIVLAGVKKGVFEKLADGAVRANLEKKYHIPDKILLRRDGTGIYMTFDIELTRQRSLAGADLLVWVVGNDQDLYFQQLFAVSELLGYGQASKFFHFSYGMVRLPEGKMSSRKGTVVYADEVIAEAITTAHQVMESAGVGKGLTQKLKDQVAIQVGVGAAKYTMLSYDPKSEIAFDLEKSVTFEGDSGPYLQYANARCNSVLEKVGSKPSQELSTWHPAEKNLVHKLEKFGNAISRAASEYSPHLLCTYLLELSQEFGRFYNQCPILGSKRREQLTKQVSQTLAYGLSLLGIATPEKM